MGRGDDLVDANEGDIDIVDVDFLLEADRLDGLSRSEKYPGSGVDLADPLLILTLLSFRKGDGKHPPDETTSGWANPGNARAEARKERIWVGFGGSDGGLKYNPAGGGLSFFGVS